MNNYYTTRKDSNRGEHFEKKSEIPYEENFQLEERKLDGRMDISQRNPIKILGFFCPAYP